MTTTSFRNNGNLRRAFTNVHLTEEQAQEYVKCFESYKYFVETYVKIINLDNGLVNFELRDYQKNMLDTLDKNRFVLVKFPRQSGKSITVIAYFLWCIIFHEYEQIAVVANKEENAIALLGRLKMAYEKLPLWLQQGVIEWNKKSVELENGSGIWAYATSGDGLRSRSFTKLLLDEFGVIRPNLAEEFMDSTYPTIASGKTTKIFVVSTPKGLNHFHKMWVDSEEGVSDFVRLEIPWNAVPGRDEEWRKKEIARIGPVRFAQEFSCVAGDTIIETNDGFKTIEELWEELDVGSV